jgi:enamine deaminase RidA (YjgF/YER057c/UK114 family)
MFLTTHNPPTVFPPYRAYSHAIEVSGTSKLLFISGLNGFLTDGKTMPPSFEEQAELVWTYLRTILQSAGMGVSNLVSIRTYLADPGDDEANVRMRMKHLEGHAPASTVVCCQLLDPLWKLEVEAVAAAADSINKA